MRADSAPAWPPAVRCADLTVRYGPVRALDGVDLTVGSGEVIAVLGASGSGKSTLLHAIAGLVQPSAGEIWLGGTQVATPRHSTPPERRRVGLVFQDFALWPHLDVLQTVAYPLRRAARGRGDAEKAARVLMAQLGIAELSNRRPGQLSGGQQQRVGLARALARDPQVFLLDEPTAHLDTHLRAAFQEAVRERQAHTGAAAVYATHDAAEALALAEQVALVVDGRLVQVAPPAVVYSEPASVATAVLTGGCTLLSADVAGLPDGRVSLDVSGIVLTVPGGGRTGSGVQRRQVLVRPDWVTDDGPLPGRVIASLFRGSHTDYQLDTPSGPVHLQLAGPPRHAEGDALTWGIRHAWVLPGAPGLEEHAPSDQPSAVIAPG